MGHKITPLLGSHFTFSKVNANLTEAHFSNDTFSTLQSQGTCKSGLSGACIPPEGQPLQNNQALKEKRSEGRQGTRRSKL